MRVRRDENTSLYVEVRCIGTDATAWDDVIASQCAVRVLAATDVRIALLADARIDASYIGALLPVIQQGLVRTLGLFGAPATPEALDLLTKSIGRLSAEQRPKTIHLNWIVPSKFKLHNHTLLMDNVKELALVGASR